MTVNKKGSNKTAHVLNVITTGQESAPPPADEPSPSFPAFSPKPNPVEVEQTSPELSDQIRDALQQELRQNLGGPPPPVRQSPDGPPPPPPQAEEIHPAFLHHAPGQLSPPWFDPAEDFLPDEMESPSKAYHYINIMQQLVEEKTPKYVQLLGVCPCSRCQADVKALALSRLEPRYLVLGVDQEFPYSAYENRYNVAVTSQIIRACRMVIDSPRH